VHTSTPVAQIARQMLDEGIDAVPVVSDHRELVGLVTGSDLIALMAYGHPRRAGAGAE
jgi:predicted transcriptional regulator